MTNIKTYNGQDERSHTSRMERTLHQYTRNHFFDLNGGNSMYSTSAHNQSVYKAMGHTASFFNKKGGLRVGEASIRRSRGNMSARSGSRN